MTPPRIPPLRLDAAQEQEVASLVDSLDVHGLAYQLAGRRGLHSLSLWTYRWASFPSGGVEAQGIPPLRFTDGPRGVNLGRSTAFPSASTRGAAWDPALEERVGEAMGREARREGATAMGSACINLIRHPAWGRAQESLGADPHHVGVLGAAHVRGLRRNVLPVVKHYALNSIEDSRFRVDVRVDAATLREVFLPHFFETIAAGAGGVMTAYNKVNGTYCGEHADLLAILREEWGFEGYTTSDFLLGCRSGLASLRAGLDQEMPQAFHYHPRRLAHYVATGQLPFATLRAAATRILRARAACGVLRPGPAPTVDVERHQALALEAAEATMVLVRDRGQTLPWRADARVGVIGPLAEDAHCGSEGSVSVAPPFTISPLEGVREQCHRVVYEPRTDPRAVARLAARVDHLLVVVGSRPRDEGEYFPLLGGGDRRTLALRESEVGAIEAAVGSGKPTVVVWVGGGLPALGAWYARTPCLLLAGHGGMLGGRALANVLFGRAVPGGHTTACVPHEHDDLAPFDPRADTVTYDRWFDYRRYDRSGRRPPLFVGHGSGQTRLRALDPRVVRRGLGPDESIEVELVLQNEGARAATPVVALYVGRDGSPTETEREPWTLRAFAKVALAPGASAPVQLTAPVAALREWDAQQDTWTLPAGPRRLSVSVAGGERLMLGEVVVRA